MTDYTVVIGNCLETMGDMASESVHCCVTSPPYFGLRDYGYEGQIGAEQTPDEYVANLVRVFREVRRVLRDDGTVWLNLGDTYNAYNGNRGTSKGKANKNHHDIMPELPGGHGLTVKALKNKDLIGIPWRVAFALQQDGWILRQDIIWHKPNPMPESVRDRCTKAHEYVFLLSKGPRYYYDQEGIKEAGSGKAPGNRNPVRSLPGERTGENANLRGSIGTTGGYQKRNRRSVWTVATRPYKGAHFATFPPDLIEPCILAGCPEGGTVLDPFGGSGTTAGVAIKNRRRAIICEMNPDYAALVPERVEQIAGPQDDLLAKSGGGHD